MSEIINHGFRVFNDDNYDCDSEFTSSSDNIKQDDNIGHHKPLNCPTKNVSLGVSSRKNKNSSASQNRHQLGIRTRKKSRDSDSTVSKNSADERKSENARIVIRKTLEVDDPIEAANSSIRTTLDINNNRRQSTSIPKAGGFFRGLQQQTNGNEHHERRHNPIDETSSMALEFNPAAFSRSLLFHEISR